MTTYQLLLPSGEARPLTRSGLLIGRAAECQVQFDMPGVSRRHARVWCDESQAFVQDEGSMNGTYVNGARLASGVPHRLRPGDSIRVEALNLTVAVAGEVDVTPVGGGGDVTPVQLPPLALPPAAPARRSGPRAATGLPLPVLVGGGVLVAVFVLLFAVVLLSRPATARPGRTAASPTAASGARTAPPSPTAAIRKSTPVAAAPANTAAPATETPIPVVPLAAAPVAIVAADTLNVREGPGTDYAIAGKLAQGDTVEVLGGYRSCSWLKVAAGPQIGWIAGSAQYVRLQTPCNEIPHGTFRALTGVLKPFAFAGGLGELTVENGTDADGVAILTQTGRTAMSAYIRSGTLLKLTGIGDGTYELYFSTGREWDGDELRFTEGASHQRFEDPLSFTTSATSFTTWKVTLHQVAGGNAAAEDVNPGQFPGAQ